MRFDHLQKGLKAELDGNVWFSLCIKFKIKSRQQNSNSRRFNSISLPSKTMVISLSLPHYSLFISLVIFIPFICKWWRHICRKFSKGKKNPLGVSNTSERQPAAITTPHEKKWTVGGGASRNRVTLIKRKENGLDFNCNNQCKVGHFDQKQNNWNLIEIFHNCVTTEFSQQSHWLYSDKAINLIVRSYDWSLWLHNSQFKRSLPATCPSSISSTNNNDNICNYYFSSCKTILCFCKQPSFN